MSKPNVQLPLWSFSGFKRKRDQLDPPTLPDTSISPDYSAEVTEAGDLDDFIDDEGAEKFEGNYHDGSESSDESEEDEAPYSDEEEDPGGEELDGEVLWGTWANLKMREAANNFICEVVCKQTDLLDMDERMKEVEKALALLHWRFDRTWVSRASS